MSTLIEKATEAVYHSMANDNKEIDERIKELKSVLSDAGAKEVVFEAARLVQNNRQGRKRLQSYFKKRGVIVAFK
jgi:hypothetical protein